MEGEKLEFHRALIPGEVLYLLSEGHLTPTDVVLLTVIDSLVKTRGEGCWMSRAKMSQMICKSPRQVKRIVKKLRDLKLIKAVAIKRIAGRDYLVLETAWSRVRVKVATGDIHDTGPVPPVSPYIDSELLRNSSSDSGYRPAAGAAMPELADTPQQGDNMPLHDVPQQNKQPSDLIKRAAKRLRKFSARMNWPISRSNRRWEVPLQILGNQVGDDLVSKAVRWYVGNHPDQIRLKLIDGHEFRERFAVVQRRMEECQQKQVEIEDLLKPVVKEVESWGWPKGKDNVPAACQLTLRASREFRGRLMSFYEGQASKNVPHVAFAGWLLEGGMPYNLNFVTDWMKRVFNRVKDWDGWHGDLIREVPQPGIADKRFNEWGRSLAQDYGNARMWDKLMGYVFQPR